MDPSAIGAALAAFLLAVGGAVYEWWKDKKARKTIHEMDVIDARDDGSDDELYERWRRKAEDFYRDN